MSRTILLAAAIVLCVACGGRIQPTQDGTDDPTTGTASGGQGSGGGNGDGTNGGGGGGQGGGFGNGGTSGSGSGSDGSNGGSKPPLPSLMLGQCSLGATGGPSFPQAVGKAMGLIEGSGRADYLSCEVRSNDDWSFTLVPTRDPQVKTTVHAQGTLAAWQGECGCPSCDCVQQTFGTVTCDVTPTEDDGAIYRASFVCDIPPRGEDLPGTHVTGAFYVQPVPDTLK